MWDWSQTKRNLILFLCYLFLNYLETFLENSNATGLKILFNEIEQELGYYVKLFVIIYADDTVLLTEYVSNLQSMLNLFQEYCIKWKLKVNIDKTKDIFLSKGRLASYGDKELKIAKYILYLGVKFSRSGSFGNAKTELVNRGTKATYEVPKRGRHHNLYFQC